MTVPEDLFALSANYAAAADQRDAARFVRTFAPDAVLVVHVDGRDPGKPNTGHAELAEIPGRLGRYHRTFHMLGQATYEVDGDTATGEVYCAAHHLRVGDDGERSDRVLYIRYRDAYARIDGAWKITQRIVHVDWIEERALS